MVIITDGRIKNERERKKHGVTLHRVSVCGYQAFALRREERKKDELVRASWELDVRIVWVSMGNSVCAVPWREDRRRRSRLIHVDYEELITQDTEKGIRDWIGECLMTQRLRESDFCSYQDSLRRWMLTC